MATIQIRNVPDEDADVLRRRADAAGLSLQAYMRREVIALARRRTKVEALASYRTLLEQDEQSGIDGDFVVETIRELRGE